MASASDMLAGAGAACITGSGLTGSSTTTGDTWVTDTACLVASVAAVVTTGLLLKLLLG